MKTCVFSFEIILKTKLKNKNQLDGVSERDFEIKLKKLEIFLMAVVLPSQLIAISTTEQLFIFDPVSGDQNLITSFENVKYVVLLTFLF